MEMSWLAFAGILYASAVVTKFIIYLGDTRRMLFMMKVMDVHPTSMTRSQFMFAFVVVSMFGLWFTVWWELLRNGPKYFRKVDDTQLYRIALRLSGTEAG